MLRRSCISLAAWTEEGKRGRDLPIYSLLRLPCGLGLGSDNDRRADSAHYIFLLAAPNDAVVSEIAKTGEVIDATGSIRSLYRRTC